MRLEYVMLLELTKIICPPSLRSLGGMGVQDAAALAIKCNPPPCLFLGLKGPPAHYHLCDRGCQALHIVLLY